MSKESNTILLERAAELAEECTNSVLGGQLEYAMKRSDMEHLYELVHQTENYLQYVELMNDGGQ
jgi:hypothetical protein